jgi:hypothetical protein
VSDTTPICPTCDKPIHDNAYICRSCGDKLTKALRHIAALHSELDITLARQSRITVDNTGGIPEPLQDWPDAEPGVVVQPMMFHVGASDVAHAINNTITTWARVILEERVPRMELPPISEPPIGPICTPTECKHESCTIIRWHIKDSEITHAAKFIAERVWWLRRRPEAPEAFKDLTGADYKLERIIDRAEPLIYAGPCNICRKDLYARQGAAQVECHPCNMAYDMEGRRSWLLEQAEDRLERAFVIARALTEWGSPIHVDRIRKWAQRGRLISHATDGLGRPLYRIGDVRELLNQDARHAVSA